MPRSVYDPARFIMFLNEIHFRSGTVFIQVETRQNYLAKFEYFLSQGLKESIFTHTCSVWICIQLYHYTYFINQPEIYVLIGSFSNTTKLYIMFEFNWNFKLNFEHWKKHVLLVVEESLVALLWLDKGGSAPRDVRPFQKERVQKKSGTRILSWIESANKKGAKSEREIMKLFK